VNGDHLPGNESGDANNDNLFFLWGELDEAGYVKWLFKNHSGSFTFGGPTAAENAHSYAECAQGRTRRTSMTNTSTNNGTTQTKSYTKPASVWPMRFKRSITFRPTPRGKGSGRQLVCAARLHEPFRAQSE